MKKIALIMLIISAAVCVGAKEVKAAKVKPAETKVIKVALACSSACEGYRESYNEDSDPRRVWGWGEVLPGYLSSNVKILNFAKSGRSTVTFRSQGYWAKLLESKPDYVIMALGANDSKQGPKHTDPATSYKDNLRRFYKEAEAIGAKTIFVTVNQSMSRGKDDMPHFNKDGKVMRKDRAPYAQAMIEVAKEFNAPCIDLFTAQAKAMELIGEAECAKLYCIKRGSNTWDPSHTNIMGAHLLANIIATEMTKINSPLAKEVNKKRLWQYKLVPVIRKKSK